jgi:hypothetical protein
VVRRALIESRLENAKGKKIREVRQLAFFVLISRRIQNGFTKFLSRCSTVDLSIEKIIIARRTALLLLALNC